MREKNYCIACGAARLPPNNYTHKAKCATTLTCCHCKSSPHTPPSPTLLMLPPLRPCAASNVNRQKSSALHSQAFAVNVDGIHCTLQLRTVNFTPTIWQRCQRGRGSTEKPGSAISWLAALGS